MHSNIDSLFNPRSIAVIGVSRREDAVGRRLFDNIVADGYAGRVYAVTANAAPIGELRTYSSIASVPERVDLAIVVVPAAKVAAVIAQCGEHGVAAAIVISAGFAETGPAGAQLQADMVAQAQRHGIRMLGPNCLGMMRAPLRLNASFSRGIARAGKLALVSQSGAVCSAIVDWAVSQQIGLSTVLSLGASADVGAGDALEYLARDPETDAILVYLEGVDHARALMIGMRAAARVKPVVVVKAGRHAVSGRAAASHTGAIVGDDAVFDAAMRRAGAVRVTTLHELFSAAEVLSHAARPAGDRLVVLTNAGGLGVLAVDHAEDLGLPLATLGAETRARLRDLLPAHASTENPIDILGDATPDRYQAALDACLSDAGVDGVVVLLSPQVMTQPDRVAAVIATAEANANKPVLACFMGGPQVQAARGLLLREQVPCFDAPEAAIEAFCTLTSHRQHQQLLSQSPRPSEGELAYDVEAGRRVITAVLDAGRSTLSQLESVAVLKAFGIACVEAIRAGTEQDALLAAETLGFPVALKIDSPDITHKTEVKGVRLDIENRADLSVAFAALLRDVKQRAPLARIAGVVVERMAKGPESRELLIGIKRDRAFGPAIAFGAGGTLVELMHDAVIGLPPLNRFLARDMIARARVAPWLAAFRGMQPIDQAALERVLIHVSALACELPEVQELDINPLIAGPHGVVALDARIVVARSVVDTQPYAHLALSPATSAATAAPREA